MMSLISEQICQMRFERRGADRPILEAESIADQKATDTPAYKAEQTLQKSDDKETIEPI